MVFQSIGTDENGMVRPQDADEMIRQTYNAIDADHDGSVTPDKLKAFSMGFEYLAQVRSKLAPFAAAKTAVPALGRQQDRRLDLPGLPRRHAG